MRATHAAADPVDSKILRTLVSDGRASVRAIAVAAGLSESATRARLAALRQAGHVEISAMVHPAAASGALAFLAFVDYEGDKGYPIDSPIITGSSWVAQVVGQPQLVIQASASDTNGLRAFETALAEEGWAITCELTVGLALHTGPGTPGETSAVAGLWAPLADRPLDDTDRRLISLLEQDGRAQYALLARAVELSVSATRRRVLALQRDGFIRIMTSVRAEAARQVQAILHLRVRLDARDALLTAAESRFGVSYAGEVAGRFSIQLSLAAPDAGQLAALVDQFASHDGVLEHVVQPITIIRRGMAPWSGVVYGQ